MASLIEELIETLSGELSVYEALVPLADRKSAVIINNDVAELERITEQEQLSAERLGALERKREKVMNSMRTVLNRRNSELRLDELIDLLAKQPEIQERLFALRKKLKSTLQTMKMLNDRNAKLITSSLEISDFQLNMIRSSRSYIGNNYTRKAGQFDMSMGPIGTFDANSDLGKILQKQLRTAEIRGSFVFKIHKILIFSSYERHLRYRYKMQMIILKE